MNIISSTASMVYSPCFRSSFFTKKTLHNVTIIWMQRLSFNTYWYRIIMKFYKKILFSGIQKNIYSIGKSFENKYQCNKNSERHEKLVYYVHSKLSIAQYKKIKKYSQDFLQNIHYCYANQ